MNSHPVVSCSAKKHLSPQQTFWLVIIGKAQVFLTTLTLTVLFCSVLFRRPGKTLRVSQCAQNQDSKAEAAWSNCCFVCFFFYICTTRLIWVMTHISNKLVTVNIRTWRSLAVTRMYLFHGRTHEIFAAVFFFLLLTREEITQYSGLRLGKQNQAIMKFSAP